DVWTYSSFHRLARFCPYDDWWATAERRWVSLRSTHPTHHGHFRVTIAPEKRGVLHGLRVARGHPSVAGNGAQICRPRIDPDRNAQHGRPRAQAGDQD